MICITDRDEKIKQFISDVGVCDTKTLHILFFPNTTIRNAQKRMKQLVDANYIKCYRENVISQNVYFIRKPKNITHKIKFSQLLAEIKMQNIELLKYRCPYKIGDIIADGLVVIKDRGKVKIYFVEAERTKKLDVSKYESLYYGREWKSIFPVMPRILCITDKKINTDHKVLNIRTCKWDLSNLKI